MGQGRGEQKEEEEPRTQPREEEQVEEQEQEEEQVEEQEQEEEFWCRPCEEEDDRGEGEEGRTPVRMATPCRPSKQEREEHDLTHTPFRAWCKYCVMGRARMNQHRRKLERGEETTEEEERGKVPRMDMDYFFMSQEDEKAGENP